MLTVDVFSTNPTDWLTISITPNKYSRLLGLLFSGVICCPTRFPEVAIVLWLLVTQEPLFLERKFVPVLNSMRLPFPSRWMLRRSHGEKHPSAIMLFPPRILCVDCDVLVEAQLFNNVGFYMRSGRTFPFKLDSIVF